MTFSSVTTWVRSGSDEAILSFVKGMLRHIVAGAIQYAAYYIGAWHPGAMEAVIAQGILERGLKSIWIYVTANGQPDPIVPTPFTEIEDTIPSAQLVDGPL